MNRKQLVILLVLVVVVGGAGLLLRQKQSASWQGADPAIGKKLLGDFPVNNVAHIAIKQGANELNLVKKEDVWRVRERADYPANYSEISEFLLKIRELKIVQTEKVGPSQLPRLALLAGQGTNSALVVDLKDQSDKPIRTLLLGKKHMKKSDRRPSPYGDMGEEGFPDGRYVKVGSDSDAVAVISDPLSNVEPKPEQWLNKDFFKVEKARSIAVTFPAATNSWKLNRETESAEWKLAEAKPTEQLDSGKASGVANPLNSPSFVDVASGAKPEDLGLDKPTIATVETFDNFTDTLKVGQKTNDNFPLAIVVAADLPKERTPGKDEKPEDKDKLDKEFKEKQTKLQEKLAKEKGYEKWIYLVSSWTVDPLLKERAQLMAEKKEEAKKDEATQEEPKPADKPVVPDAPKKEEPAPPAPDPKPESK
jgi:hypothetical protein